MKKKAQAKTIVIILLVIIAIALVAIVIKQFKPSIAGNVINENTNEEINEDGSVKESCVLEEPFVCLSNSIATSRGVLFFINNKGDEDLFIQKMRLTNCLDGVDLTNKGETKGVLVNTGTTASLTLLCDNKLENLFEGSIEITYQVVGSPAMFKATGSIVRKVL